VRRRARHITNLIDRWLWIVALTVVSLAVASAVGGRARAPRAASALVVGVQQVPLDPGSPDRQSVGSLVYAGGLWLSSDDSRFGGLSDLRVSEDGSVLRAVSDCGRGLTATLSYDEAGRLAGLADVALYDLTGLAGEALRIGEIDSESLVLRDDRLEIGFEGRGRIWSYALQPPFAGPARPVPTPEGLKACGPNAGLEAMAGLESGQRLLVCEGRRSASADVPAWIGPDGAWTERSYQLFFEGGWAAEPFRPTGATRLPNGDALVVERRFPPIGARIVRLSASDLAGQNALHPLEIARFEQPLTLDNFEGIDARLDASGRTLVYLVSDDNNCAKKPGGPRGTGLQRTLLLMFELRD
jgi:hypothetical protein